MMLIICCQVVIIGRSEERLRELALEYLMDDDRLVIVTGDFSTWDGAQAVAEKVHRSPLSFLSPISFSLFSKLIEF